MSTIEADAKTQSPSEQDSHNAFERDVAATQQYQDSPRFDGITRLFSARQVAEQRGTIPADYTSRVRPPKPSTRGCASSSRNARASPRSGRTPPARP